MKIDPNDRIGGPADEGGSKAILLSLIGILVLAAAAGAFVFRQELLDLATQYDSATKPYAAVYEHFEIEPLPKTATRTGTLKRTLNLLKREKCDTAALFEFTRELGKQGYRRAAATALITFSRKCGTSETALARAYKLFGDINDHTLMIETANQLIDLKDFAPDYHYWRGIGFMKQGEHRKALDDFITTVELQSRIDRVHSVVFSNQSKMYEELGRICEAITPIQTWVSIDPADRDTAQSRTLIARIAERGGCDSTYADGTARFRITKRNHIVVETVVNGQRAALLLDTGASFVSLSSSFANKAGIEATANSHIKLQTANGVVSAKTAVAETVAVGAAKAQGVTVVIHDSGSSGIDGLLGMSFLARFDLKLGDREWSIAARQK